MTRTVQRFAGTVPVSPMSDIRSAVSAVNVPKQAGMLPRILVNWDSSNTTKFVRLHKV